jgi:hypothetical protein
MKNFLGVCRVCGGLQGMRIGAIGAGPLAFSIEALAGLNKSSRNLVAFARFSNSRGVSGGVQGGVGDRPRRACLSRRTSAGKSRSRWAPTRSIKAKSLYRLFATAPWHCTSASAS